MTTAYKRRNNRNQHLHTTRNRLIYEPLEDRRLLASTPLVGEEPPLCDANTASAYSPSRESFPPLQAISPAGSLIYDPPLPGSIDAEDEVDEFPITVDEFQTITVVVIPAEGLRPSVSLQGPDADPEVVTDTAPAGGAAIIQTHLSVTGEYVVAVSGADGTTGDYTVEIILNAALEVEEFARPRNDNFTVAQDLEPAFTSLEFRKADRGAVLGRSDTADTVLYAANMDSDPGWTLEGGVGAWEYGVPIGAGGDPAAGDTGDQVIGYNLNGEYPTGLSRQYATTPAINVAGASQVTLSFQRWLGVASAPNGAATVEASSDGLNWTVLWENETAVTDTEWTLQQFDLSEIARNQPWVFVRWGLGPTDGDTEFAGWNIDDVLVTSAGESTSDWYRFSLGNGEHATIAGSSLEDGSLSISLYDGDGQTLLARNASTEDPDLAIGGFIDPTIEDKTNDYYVEIAGSGSRYALVITRNADFDTEPNDSRDEAQAFTGGIEAELVALGFVSQADPEDEASAADDSDYYRFFAEAGAELTLTAIVPGDGPGEPPNGLNPSLTLSAVDGSEITSGRSLQHTVDETGIYQVRVSAVEATSGAYVVGVEGATAISRPFMVEATDLDGAPILAQPPAQITIDFSEILLLTSLAPEDFTVNGVPATNLSVLDGDSIRVDVPQVLTPGTNSFAVESGALVDIHGTPLSAFELEIELAQVAPRIIASSLQPGDVVAAGDLDVMIQFDEDIATDELAPADIGLVGERSGVRDFAGFDYDVDTHTLTVSFLQLAEDHYTLTLSSAAFQDLDGNELDGENEGLAIPPDISGDGSPGGDFRVEFSADVVVQPFPGPLEPVLPLGSLVYEGATTAEISNADDEDRFTIDVDAPQNITIIATAASDLIPGISLFQDDMTLIGTAAPLAEGQPAVLSSAVLPTAGTYTIAVGSEDGSVGRFELRIVLNAAAELESFGGSRNDSLASAQDLTAAFVGVGDGSVGHAAVLGTAESSLLDLSPTLIAAGSVWKFLDNGSNQGTAWREPDFDDSTWDSGPAELGYGDGDEVTEVGFVHINFGKNLTTYFRHAFQLDDDPARFFQMALRLKRDDGAAVYLNGVEILRDNLLPDATYLDPATSTAAGTDESEFHLFLIDLTTLPQGVLRRGENVVAVEVHQESGESPDISFDLDLEAFATVPGATNVDAPTFVTTESIWSYLDDGSDLGTAWRDPDFDDGSWSSGPAILGYGDDDVSTIVDFGPNAQQKFITTYFRHRFVVDDDPARFEHLFLDLLRDDGAAVYLNGFEIARDNLGPDAAFDDFAATEADGPSLLQLIDLRSLPAGVLRQGENVLAVEIHQSTRNGSDILFDLSLQGFGAEAERRDWYRLALQDGETATIGVQQFSEGEVHLDLFAADGTTWLATGANTDNVHQLIANFHDLTSDGAETAYYLQVDGDGSEYNLFVTRNADFDAEPNRGFSEAQPSLGVLGGLTASGPGTGALLTDFAGIDTANASCTCEPPDPHLAVGPDHVVEVVNNAIAMYNKDGSVASPPQDLALFLSPEVVNEEGFIFDPVITYDELAERWVFAVVIGAEASAEETDLLYAVSDTSDPTGSWTEQHRIDFGNVSPGLFADFPRIGWNADAYVISFNMFDAFAFIRVNVVTIRKSTALDANPATQAHFISERSSGGFTLVPAIMRDAQPGDPMWLVETNDFENGNAIRVVRMTNVLSSVPSYTDVEVPVSPYSFPLATPQSLGFLNVGDTRMLSAEWRADRLVTAHSVGGDGETSVRWYEFETGDVTPTLLQEGTINPGPGVYAYYPSIAINAAGDIGMTYLQSSNRQFVAMYATGHVAGTAPGTLVHPLLVKIGDKSYKGVRGGDYSGIGVDPVTDSFWAANEVILQGPENSLWNTWIAEFTVADNLDDDWYSFPVEAGSQLVVSADTLGADAGEPPNDLAAAIELFGPDGAWITSDSARTGGPEVQLVHDAAESGTYRVRVYSENDTQGVYRLDVEGAVDENAAPQVIEAIPIDGLRVNAFPTSVTLKFSEGILLDSISRDDVLIGGEPAISLKILDGRTFEFLIDPAVDLGDGEYVVEMPEGSVFDLNGRGNVAHSSSFILDQTGPRIIGTSWNGQPFPPGGVFEPGPLTVAAEFDESLFTLSSARRGLRTPGTDDIKLTDTMTGEDIFPQSLEFDSATNTISAHFAELAAAEYELRFVSGTGAFEDIVGNDLDGEPRADGPDGTPTGDGISGGDWFVDFNVDISVRALTDLVRLEPLGGHVARQNIGATLGMRNLDRYEVFAEAGEIVTAIARPSNPAAVLYLNENAAPSPGEAVVYVTAADANGIINVDVTGTAATDYTLEVILNAAVEAASGDTAAGSTLRLDDFLLPIGSGLVSVVGNVTSTLGDAVVFSEDFADGLGEFVTDNDYGRGGGLWHLSTGRSADGEPNHTPPNSLYYGKDENDTGGGNIDAGAPHSGAFESPSIDLPVSTGITLSLQHLISRGHGQASRDDVAEVAVDDGNGFVTLLSTADESLLADTGGGWQTATADLTAFAGSTIKLRFTFDTGEDIAHLDEGWYVDDISIFAEMVNIADTDAYTIDLSENVGRPIDIVMARIGETDLPGMLLELVDPTGAVAAVGTPWASPSDGSEVAILDYVVPDLGDNIYTLRVGSVGPGEYGIVIARSMLFGVEPDLAGKNQLRRIDSSSLAVGFLDTATDPIDSFLLTLPAGRPVVIGVSTPLNAPQSRPESTLQPQFSFADASSAALPGVVERLDLPGVGIVLTAAETVDIQTGIAAESGLGEYLWEIDVAVLDGDFNDDGELNCTDLDALTSAMVTGEDMSLDVSGDGLLDANDLLLWQVMANQANFGAGNIFLPGDANLDGAVDGSDFEIWSGNRFTELAGWCNGDFNVDGNVDASDFNLWNNNRFSAGAAAATYSSAPAAAARTPRAPATIPAAALTNLRFPVVRQDSNADLQRELEAVADVVFQDADMMPFGWGQLPIEKHRQRRVRDLPGHDTTRGDNAGANANQRQLRPQLIDAVLSRVASI